MISSENFTEGHLFMLWAFFDLDLNCDLSLNQVFYGFCILFLVLTEKVQTIYGELLDVLYSHGCC